MGPTGWHQGVIRALGLQSLKGRILFLVSPASGPPAIPGHTRPYPEAEGSGPSPVAPMALVLLLLSSPRRVGVVPSGHPSDPG